ncbi:hypothetical protein I4F81_012121 [Pyropia yezoensis]|uniref:Uncharacterized protein n=1 Tax=Pyropia yezoensis TaxID=2788 RepID=A0ACC3CI17_PYRYE|nr:hypothetical protein I4F81_012121 [Neopyropia yezoensis]
MEGNGRALPGDGRTTQTPEHEMPAYRVAARRAYREYLRTPRECYYCDKKKRLYMSPKGWFTACRACHIWFYGKNSPWLGPRARAAARAAAGGGASSVEVNGDSGGAPAAGVGEGDAATIGDEGDAAPVAVSEAGGSGIAVEEGSPNDPVAVSNT